MSVDLAEPVYGSLADRAYHELRDRLVLLELPPGSAINEGGLAAELGIGRTPVREALKQLERDHLVVSYPRRGTFATRVDITDLVDVSEVRLALEPVAAARAAHRGGAGLRPTLAEKAEQVADLDPSSQDWRALMRFDMDVHRLVYRAAGNPHLEETLVRLDNLATRIWCLVVDRLPAVGDHIVEHAELLRAIVDRRPERAADLAREHVRRFEESVRAVL